MPRQAPGPDFGDTVTGRAADDQDWSASGPRPLSPRRIVTGTVVGLYANSRTAAKVRTRTGEIVCVRVIGRPRRGRP